MTNNIRIVLIKTWHAGNIGAVARAMKNMGLSQLYLVDPIDFPSDEATSRAGQATDLLEQAVVVQTLNEAIQDCSLVIGTSARDRSIPLPSLNPEQCAQKAVHEQQKSPVAIVFGRERTGLHNEEINQCHFQVNIDANPEYPVLNLSQAVQIICYELFKCQVANTLETPEFSNAEQYPLHKEMSLLNEHLKQTCEDTGFTNSKHPGNMLEHLTSALKRARLTKKELSIFRGFLSSIQRKER